MIKVSFDNENITVNAQRGATALDAARQGGVYLASPCGGNGTCGKCQVAINGETVLACCTPLSCDCIISTSATADQTLQIVSSGHSTAHALNPHYNNGYGLVVDIGTTTLVVSLCDLATGTKVATESLLNPQTQYAQDVISRIQFAGQNDGLSALHTTLTKSLNAAIARLTAQIGIAPRDIKDAIYSGNTVMLHLAVGADPTPLGKYPYTPNITGGCYFPARKLNIGGEIYMPPIVSPFVGADIACGILACDLTQTTATTLFIDIGTNGEMVLAKDGNLVATSTAAGPAFEGMNISQGKRASIGAIERFAFNDDDTITIETIGNTDANGICGSGLLDIVAALVRTGRVDSTGRFSDKSNAFTITPHVSLTQGDIRQVQLAKGAIRAGIDAMLDRLSLTPQDIERVEIAGSFGYHVSERSLLQLKMLPAAFAGKIYFVGNTSQSGGMALLLNTDLRRDVERMVQEVKHIDFGNDEAFDDLFVENLGF
ncbi:MAG: ASKHA domain-containing protein [Oscillospiraceae bacterium]|nr:ASKHA domain-containing protein [Oscillospiraceae bacterium]